MRKLMLAAAAIAALVAAGAAVAHGIDGAKVAKGVTAGFNATPSGLSTRTCTTSDGKTLEIANARYTGTATGDADLAGTITIRARSIVNTSDGVGVVDGAFRIDVASGRDTRATFAAVYDHGTIAGLAVGRAHDPSARLVANFSAGFSAAGGFSGAKLGGGTASGSAVELGPGSCAAKAGKAEKSEARGTISALSTSSITVAGLSCQLPADKAASINAQFKLGDRAEIRCVLVGGANTLTRIEHRH